MVRMEMDDEQLARLELGYLIEESLIRAAKLRAEAAAIEARARRWAPFADVALPIPSRTTADSRERQPQPR